MKSIVMHDLIYAHCFGEARRRDCCRFLAARADETFDMRGAPPYMHAARYASWAQHVLMPIRRRMTFSQELTA